MASITVRIVERRGCLHVNTTALLCGCRAVEITAVSI